MGGCGYLNSSRASTRRFQLLGASKFFFMANPTEWNWWWAWFQIHLLLLLNVNYNNISHIFEFLVSSSLPLFSVFEKTSLLFFKNCMPACYFSLFLSLSDSSGTLNKIKMTWSSKTTLSFIWKEMNIHFADFICQNWPLFCYAFPKPRLWRHKSVWTQQDFSCPTWTFLNYLER